MILTYEDIDIADQVNVTRCMYEACEFGRIPSLSLEFDDDAGLWDRWGPQAGDAVRVTETGAGDTGIMYVDRVVPSAGGYAIHATALPMPDLRTVREWGNTTLFTVMRQIAAALGLSFESHGCDDMSIVSAKQDDERGMALAGRIAALAGCTVDVHGGTMHLCGRSWVESQGVVGTLELGDDSDYTYTRRQLYRSCMITQPESGTRPGIVEVLGSGDPRLAVVLDGRVAFPGSAELRQACAGLLAFENSKRSCGNVHGGALSPYTPGTIVNVACAGSPSLSGRSVVTRVRNDFAANDSKIWWRAL